MSSFCIANNNNIFIYYKQTLNKLKMTESSKKKLLGKLKMPKSNLIEIPDELALHILRVRDNIKDREAHDYSIYKLSYNSAILIDKGKDSLKEYMFFNEYIEVNPLIDIFLKTVVCEADVYKNGDNILIDLDNKDVVRKVWLFEDFSYKKVDFNLAENIIQIPLLKKLDKILKWQSESIYDFKVRPTAFYQIPYKMNISNNGKYFAGEDLIAIDLHVSFCNIEKLLKDIYQNYYWVVVENIKELINKCCRLFFKNEYSEEIEFYMIKVKGINIESRTINMINKYVGNLEKIYIQVRRNTRVNVYSMRVIKENKICTQWVYGTNPQDICVNVLEHFYAIYHQNNIIFGRYEENNIGRLCCLEELECCNVESLIEILNTRYQLYKYYIENLENAGIAVFSIKRRRNPYE